MLCRKLFTHGLPQGLLTATLGVALLAGGLATPAEAQKGKSGTTLAAAKDLNICSVSDNRTPDDASDDTWRYYGNISVWQEGAKDTEGLAISDAIQFKAFNASGQFVDTYPVIVPMTATVIPAYTPEQDAILFPYSVDAPALNGYIRNSATVTITNHSGHLNTAWGPNPKFTYSGPLGLDVPPCEQENNGGCAYSQGYWKNHRPGGQTEGPWPGADPNALFYSAAELVCTANCGGKDKNDDVFVNVPQTWAQVLNHPDTGNPYYKLAHQYIAAILNVNNGAAGVSSITDPGGYLEQATNWFNTSTNTPASCEKQGSVHPCGTQGAWAGLLEAYNTGGYAVEGGPAHCDDDDSID